MMPEDKKFNVVVVGELNVDVILSGIAGFPEVGKEIIARDMTVTLGSSSAIFASNLSALGSRVSFVGKIGQDNFAAQVLGSLLARKVDTGRIIRSSTSSTGATLVLNYGQDRAMVTYPGAMEELRLDDIRPECLEEASHLHFSSCFLQPGIRQDLPELFRRAKQMGLTTSLDPQWDPAESWDLPLDELLPWVDVFLPNKQEFLNLTKSFSLEEAIGKVKSFANLLVIKDGSNGAWAWDGAQLLQRPPYLNNEVVDCIGAGDSFNAGFIHKFVRKESLQECLSFGALTGAMSTTEAGGTNAFEQMDRFIRVARDKFHYIV